MFGDTLLEVVNLFINYKSGKNLSVSRIGINNLSSISKKCFCNIHGFCTHIAVEHVDCYDGQHICSCN